MSKNKIVLQQANNYEIHQSSFYNGNEQDANIPPNLLSGDQNGTESLIHSISDSKNKANFLLTVTTIVKTVIGSGILGLPYTVSKCGYVFSIIVFISAAMVTQLGSVLLLKAKNLSGHSNFSTILYHIYQNKFSKSLGSILIVLNNLGICILQIIVLKTTTRKIIEELIPDNPALEEFYTSKIFIALIVLLFQIPFILVNKIEKLKFMAFIGVNGIFIFVTSFLVHYILTSIDFTPTIETRSMSLFPSDWFEAIASIPNLLLALSFHMNFFPVYKGMRNVNDRKITLATLIGILICSVFYLLIGILGYHLVYTMNNNMNINANFLESISYSNTNHIVFFIINCGLLLSVFCAFPIMFFGCRNNFIALIQLFMIVEKDKNGQYNQQQQRQEWRARTDNIELISSFINAQDKIQKRKKAHRLFVIYTFAIFSVIFGISISVDNIQIVFNIIGAVCSTSITVLMPCFFYFKLIVKKKKTKKTLFYLTIFLFIIMIPFAIFSMVAENI